MATLCGEVFEEVKFCTYKIEQGHATKNLMNKISKRKYRLLKEYHKTSRDHRMKHKSIFWLALCHNS